MVSGGPLSILELLKRSEDFLREHGCQSPRLDAQVLLADVLGCDRVMLYVDYAKPLTEQELDTYRTFIRRRANHEPVAYITGTKEFWSMEFSVDTRVLIPRPDTETVVEEALDRCKKMHIKDLVDVGTGSGCLCAALLKEFDGSHALAVDSEDGALEVAEHNLKKLGFEDRVMCMHGSLLDGALDRTFDLLCANLPYIPRAELELLPDQVRLYEPISALDGGEDGLDSIRKLIECAPDHLNPGGVLILEIGHKQAERVQALCLAEGLTSVRVRQDLAGLDRVVSAARV